MLDNTSETKKSERVDITADTVKLASRLAAKAVDSSQMLDWFDTRQHYLQLRQRGHGRHERQADDAERGFAHRKHRRRASYDGCASGPLVRCFARKERAR